MQSALHAHYQRRFRGTSVVGLPIFDVHWRRQGTCAAGSSTSNTSIPQGLCITGPRVKHAVGDVGSTENGKVFSQTSQDVIHERRAKGSTVVLSTSLVIAGLTSCLVAMDATVPSRTFYFAVEEWTKSYRKEPQPGHWNFRESPSGGRSKVPPEFHAKHVGIDSERKKVKCGYPTPGQ